MKKSINLQEIFLRLEQIEQILESESADIDESIKLCLEADKLIKDALSYLDQAQFQIKEIKS